MTVKSVRRHRLERDGNLYCDRRQLSKGWLTVGWAVTVGWGIVNALLAATIVWAVIT